MKFKWYTDGTSTVRVSENSSPPAGYWVGRTFKTNPWNKGKTKAEDSRIRASSSSFQKGHKSWNEGLTKETSEILWFNGQKISAANKGKQPWNVGIPMSKEARIKLAANHNTQSWNRGETKDTNSTVARIAAKLKGHPVSESTIQKGWATKRSRNSCTRSKAEDDFYLDLCIKYGQDQVHRNYSKDPRYPYPADFYISSEDLFIELNLYWTHGGHPFNPEEESDLQTLQEWKMKALCHPQYAAGIKTWTQKDPVKLDTMRKNRLNYVVIYPTTTLLSS